MANISKPANINQIWSSGGDILKPSDSKIAQGWTAEIPPRQWFNWDQNRKDQAIAHINQHGIAVWDNVTEYQQNSWAKGSDGVVYIAQSVNVNKNPTTTDGASFWTSLPVYFGSMVSQSYPGEYKMVAHNGAPPSGWLKCNGAIVDRAQYPNLFAVIGTTYNAAGNITNAQFQLPDLRGEFVRGLDDGRGVDPVRSMGSSQGQSFQSHSHDIYGDLKGSQGWTGGIEVPDGYSDQPAGNQSAQSYLGRTRNTGGGETRPRNISVVYWIKT